ncbi:MAG: hypothetical protein M0R18_13440, partial [Deltaproteobacteria bacterium]|nr:hypothetical protein [Deltaproteobacteria bacterium]
RLLSTSHNIFVLHVISSRNIYAKMNAMSFHRTACHSSQDDSQQFCTGSVSRGIKKTARSREKGLAKKEAGMRNINI